MPDREDVTFGPPRRVALVGDCDRINLRTLGYLELREGENPPLPIRPVACAKGKGLIAAVWCWMRRTKAPAAAILAAARAEQSERPAPPSGQRADKRAEGE